MSTPRALYNGASRAFAISKCHSAVREFTYLGEPHEEHSGALNPHSEERMNSPVTVSFRRLARSAGVESRARELGERLQRLDSRITACHITVQSELDDHMNEAQCVVNIHLNLPGALIHADSIQRVGVGHRDVYVALHDAFEDARRQLDSLRLHRGAIPLTGNFPDTLE